MKNNPSSNRDRLEKTVANKLTGAVQSTLEDLIEAMVRAGAPRDAASIIVAISAMTALENIGVVTSANGDCVVIECGEENFTKVFNNPTH